MHVSPEMISYREEIGTIDGSKVLDVYTTGGLHMLFTVGDKPELIGSAPHIAIAKHIAKKNRPGIKWIKLEKSDLVDYNSFKHLVPKYEQLTDLLARKWNER